MDQTVVDYIKKTRELGYSDADIKSLLLNAGHDQAGVEGAFAVADGRLNSSAVLVPPPVPTSNSQHSSFRPEDTNNSTLQTKSNLWAGGTIFANLFIVGLIYGLLNYGLTFLLQNNPIYLVYLGALSPIIGIAVEVFAIWLGVRSVTKVTRIDPKNFLRVSLYSTAIPFLFIVVLIVFVLINNPASQINWFPGMTEYLFYGLTLVVFAYYFISRNPKIKYAALIILSISLVAGISQGYSNYQDGMAALQEAQSFKQAIKDILMSNKGTEVPTAK
ncbi:MAG: hypothetical protein PHS95_01415 [Candidatus Pacebacteria bacterium]|nr:hypothetical protein [Candidatus Paceibacterota bacterium]